MLGTQPDEEAYVQLKIIVKAINEGWTPDWNDENEKKWNPWFKLSSGFGFVISNYTYTGTFTTVGSRLCFSSKEKSDYAATEFISIYEKLLK